MMTTNYEAPHYVIFSITRLLPSTQSKCYL